MSLFKIIIGKFKNVSKDLFFEEIDRIIEITESTASKVSGLEASLARLEASLASHKAILDQLNNGINEKISQQLNLRDELLRQLGQATVAESIEELESPIESEKKRFKIPFPFSPVNCPQYSKIHVIDVGAQNLSSEEHVYSELRKDGHASVIGFEPLADKMAERVGEKDTLMLGNFIGKGGKEKFFTNKFDPTSSLYETNHDFVSQFIALPEMLEHVSEELVETTRLDDIEQIKTCDFIKLDVQGAELDVIKGGINTISEAIAIQCEVEFSEVYKNQPLFSDIDSVLRRQGFELIRFINLGNAGYEGLKRPISNSRLLWAEAIYFKLPSLMEKAGAGKLLKAVLVAHYNYSLYDLAHSYLRAYDKLLSTEYADKYASGIETYLNHYNNRSSV